MGYIVQNQYGVVTVNDEATINEPKEIRFITPEYKDLFKIPDGGHVLVTYRDGEVKDYTCKYLDEYHLLLGYRAFHICELAECMQNIGARIEPFPEKRIVWSNRDLDLEDWIEDLRENYPDEDREQLYNRMCEINDEYFDDERMNLNCHVGDDIIAIADLERWNGRFQGYKKLNSDNLRDCLEVLKDCEYNEWYVDRDGEFRSTQSHHDGTHHIYYRQWKPETTDEQREELLESIYYGKAAQKDIDALTDKLGKAVGTVYGWSFPTETKEKVRTER